MEESFQRKCALHCLGFLAQFGDYAPNAEEEVNDDYLSLSHVTLKSGKAMRMKNLERVCSKNYLLFGNFNYN